MAIEAWATTGRSNDSESKPAIQRAMQRTVHRVGTRRWVVEGSARLSDSYDNYVVTLRENATYECDCYNNARGEIRRRKGCSHVMAVKLCRKGQKDYASNTANDDLEPITIKPSSPTLDSNSPPTPAVVVEPPEGEGNAHALVPAPPLPAPTLQLQMSEDDGVALPPDPTQTLRQDGGGEVAERNEGETSVPSHAPSNPPGYSPTITKAEYRNLPDTPPQLTADLICPPGYPKLPARFEAIRQEQWEAIVNIVTAFDEGAKVVFLDAPTGSGKTLIGEVVKRIYAGRVKGASYSCTTKSLQEQILRDFDYGHVIKGRSNYPTVHGGAGVTCEDCTGNFQDGDDSCAFCPSMQDCPYRVAKRKADLSFLPVLNLAYFLRETKGQQSAFFGRKLAVIDESDTVEDQLLSYYEIVYGARTRKALGVTTAPKKTVAEDWDRWLAEDMLPAIEQRIKDETYQMALNFTHDVEKNRRVDRLQKMAVKTRKLIKDGVTGWILTGYQKNKDLADQTFIFKPILVDDLAREVLWGMADKLLLMSATTISAEQEAEDLGLEDGEWASVIMESTFPPENRPILPMNVTGINYKNKDQSYPKIAKAIQQIIEENPGVRILVHTVSYYLAQYMVNHVKSNRTMTYTDASQRDAMLAKFLTRNDSVLFAPSFERGIDLPGEDCEIIIIAKVPYPNVGDGRIAARMRLKGGQRWYAKQTVRAMVQMTGRGMRHKDDWCDTYILDSAFMKLYKENTALFPNWWKDALILSSGNPKYKGLRDAMNARREARQ